MTLTRPLLLLLLALATVAPAAIGQSAAPLGLDNPRLTEPPAGEPLTGEALEAKTEDIASRLRCPSCQALSVADSPTDSSLAIRGEIQELLKMGYTDEQVVSYFERSYGEFIRLAPKPTGFNLVAWLAPIVALVLGLFLVLRRLRTSPAQTSSEPESGELDDYLQRVREEVRS